MYPTACLLQRALRFRQFGRIDIARIPIGIFIRFDGDTRTFLAAHVTTVGALFRAAGKVGSASMTRPMYSLTDRFTDEILATRTRGH